MKPHETIKTYGDACKAIGVKPKKRSLIKRIFVRLFGKKYSEKIEADEAYEKIRIITSALNGGQFMPNWENKKYTYQWKH